jgi:hypothetical protein
MISNSSLKICHAEQSFYLHPAPAGNNEKQNLHTGFANP